MLSSLGGGGLLDFASAYTLQARAQAMHDRWVFMRANGMREGDLNVVSLEANAKTTALFGGRIDVVSGDAPAFEAYVRATDQEPV